MRPILKVLRKKTKISVDELARVFAVSNRFYKKFYETSKNQIYINSHQARVLNLLFQPYSEEIFINSNIHIVSENDEKYYNFRKFNESKTIFLFLSLFVVVLVYSRFYLIANSEIIEAYNQTSLLIVDLLSIFTFALIFNQFYIANKQTSYQIRQFDISRSANLFVSTYRITKNINRYVYISIKNIGAGSAFNITFEAANTDLLYKSKRTGKEIKNIYKLPERDSTPKDKIPIVRDSLYPNESMFVLLIFGKPHSSYSPVNFDLFYNDDSNNPDKVVSHSVFPDGRIDFPFIESLANNKGDKNVNC